MKDMKEKVEEYKAVLKGVRVSPRKARLVADLVRGRLVQDALDILKFSDKKTAPLVFKLIGSAVANASYGSTVDADNLVVSDIFVDGGAMLKRFMPRAQGRATPIRKRTSHITVKLKEI